VLALDWIDYRGGNWAMVRAGSAQWIQVRVTASNSAGRSVSGPDGRFGTADDLQMENELHVPVNKVVRVSLRSKDVIHSFFLPNLRLKQDTLPGREIQAWFEATKPGRYELPCAELCGFGHSGMRGWLNVHPDSEYTRWLSEHWPS
jgi:cytochrome c oxidase subunit 2